MSLETLVLFFLFFAVGGWAQEKPQSEPADKSAASATPAEPHPATVSAEDKARKNPVKFTETSVARGKKRYVTQCALCHGDKGDGKGDVAADMKLTVPDFTNPDTLKDRTDGELFAFIGTGKEPMPGQGTRMKVAERWDLVNYLRSISGKTPEKSTGKEPEENIILVPQ